MGSEVKNETDFLRFMSPKTLLSLLEDLEVFEEIFENEVEVKAEVLETLENLIGKAEVEKLLK